MDLALLVLDEYGRSTRRSDGGIDAGPAVLAGLCTILGPAPTVEVGLAALRRWLQHSSSGAGHPALCGGMAGILLGATTAQAVDPSLGALRDLVRTALTDATTARLWRTTPLAWRDYDVVSGPSGVVLALAADGQGPVGPAARHLVSLCTDNLLSGLRFGDGLGDPRVQWGLGQVNTGLAHGVAGVAAALTAALSAGADPEFRQALRRVCDWLVDQAGTDRYGIVTWPPAGGSGHRSSDEPSRRQAWCYGTPGISWMLHEAGEVLDAPELRACAATAFASYCAAFDPDFHLDTAPVSSRLGVCHGAAGVLAIADAFALHAGEARASALGAELEALLLAHSDDVIALAASDMSLLTGAAGVLAVLLSRTSPTRTWMRAIALR
ncbi:MAG: hypothetical protein L0H64_04205 [Pseudonocardia sp.]|nr:hypothetical protein [Pseudonocardia sp.]